LAVVADTVAVLLVVTAVLVLVVLVVLIAVVLVAAEVDIFLLVHLVQEVLVETAVTVAAAVALGLVETQEDQAATAYFIFTIKEKQWQFLHIY
jgi:hypothetical protein